MNLAHWVAWLYWDPPIEAFTVPFIDRPVVWYGILFVTGFIIGYFIFTYILSQFLKNSRQLFSIDITNWAHLIEILRDSSSPFNSQFMLHFDSITSQQLKQQTFPPITSEIQKGILEGLNRLLQQSLVSRDELQKFFGEALATPKQTAYFLSDRLCWFIVAGTVIGARLGEVFFYNWDAFVQNPLEIFEIWHGGLSSHGGVLAVFIAIYLYRYYIRHWIPQLTFLRLLDYVAVPSALAGCFIRLGNFMNQEILGKPTTLPWGIVFGHPFDHSLPQPRHPVQLYEAGAYLLCFVILWNLWKKQKSDERPGALVGWLFVLIFSSRFILEFWKANLESTFSFTYLQMGQLLSIPFILLGIFLIWQSKRPSYTAHKVY